MRKETKISRKSGHIRNKKKKRKNISWKEMSKTISPFFLPIPITISYSQSVVLLVGEFHNFHLYCFSFLRKSTMEI